MRHSGQNPGNGQRPRIAAGRKLRLRSQHPSTRLCDQISPETRQRAPQEGATEGFVCCTESSRRAECKTCAARIARTKSREGRRHWDSAPSLRHASATLKQPAKTRGKQTRKDAPPCHTLAGSRFLLRSLPWPRKAATRPPGQSASSGLLQLQQRGMCTHHQAESRLSAAQVTDTRDAHKCASAQPLRFSRTADYLPGRVAVASVLGIMQTASGILLAAEEVDPRPSGQNSWSDLIRSALVWGWRGWLGWNLRPNPVTLTLRQVRV
jgi:hypothetical protein